MTTPTPATLKLREMRERLATTWPRLFEPSQCNKWPTLALGTREHIAQALSLDDDGIKILSRLLAAHCASIPYLHALAAARPRTDLDGNPAGTVTPEQQAKAAAVLSERLAQRKAKRQATQAKRPPGKPTAQDKHAKPARKVAPPAPPNPFQTPPAPGPLVLKKKRRTIAPGK